MQRRRTRLKAAGVALGADYPRPVVEHGAARERALAAFAASKSISDHD